MFGSDHWLTKKRKMHHNFIGLILLFVCACQSPKPEVVQILASNADYKNAAVELDLDSCKSHNDLFYITDSLWYSESKVHWSFVDTSYSFKIQVLGLCDGIDIRWHPNHADFIALYTTHFVKNETLYPYDSLKTVMLRDLMDHGQNPEFAQSPEKAFLIFTVRQSDTMKTIKQVLAKVALAHLEIPGNKYINMVVGKAIEPPPPPPGYL